MTTRYNVHFNGYTSYQEGIENIEKSLKEDYSMPLPMFTYHNHENLKRAEANMDRAIEKSIKAIKRHSIKRKPKRKRGQASDPEFQQWYNREEFNKMVPKAYMLMGKATFHKGEFLESIGIFNYVFKHFPQYPEYHYARLWMTRAYAELEWLYEAENVLDKVAEDETFPTWMDGEYAKVKADLLLKQGRFDAVVPYLKTTIAKEKNRIARRRYTYILGQIYQELGNDDEAYPLFEKVIKMNPPYEMAFNARIRLTEVYSGEDGDDIRKVLHKMLKDEKNKEYHDQIYYALANLELDDNKKEEAIKLLVLSIQNSTQNEFQKANSMLLLGDLYYEQGMYRKAQPNYAGAAGLLDEDHPEIERIAGLSRVLDQLAAYFETISTNDSLLKIAKMNDSEQEMFIEKLIDDVKKQEKELQQAALSGEGERDAMLANNSEWYFYNNMVVDRGKSDFQRKWGRRTLEDHWRRTSKPALVNNFNNNGETTQEEEIPEQHTFEYYTKNIPKTQEEIIKKERDIADAYVGIGDIYKIKLQNYLDAEAYYSRLIQRYPKDKNILDAKFGLYQVYVITEQFAKAEDIKQQIINEFPNSRFGIILSNPNYAQELKAIKLRQDSLYNEVYENFKQGNFLRSGTIAHHAIKKYPDSELKPNFMFMKALSISRAGNADSLKSDLTKIKTTYPEHDVTEHANRILDMLEQGMEVAVGGSGGTLVKDTTLFTLFDDAKEVTAPVNKKLFELDEDARHYYVFIFRDEEVDKNLVLYELARFNFNKFLVKDFDLNFNILSKSTTILIVNGFDGMEESLWYQQVLQQEGMLDKLFGKVAYRGYIISDANFRSLITQRDTRKYEAFYDENYLPKEGSVENPFEIPEVE